MSACYAQVACVWRVYGVFMRTRLTYSSNARPIVRRIAQPCSYKHSDTVTFINAEYAWLTATHVAYGLGNFSEQVLFVFYGCTAKVAVSRCDIFRAGNHARAHFIPCACHFLPSWGGAKILQRMSSGTSCNTARTAHTYISQGSSSRRSAQTSESCTFPTK